MDTESRFANCKLRMKGGKSITTIKEEYEGVKLAYYPKKHAAGLYVV